jgi:hypothetical protein
VREPFNYPGRPLTAQEKEEQKTKRYPNMFPAEGTVLFKFLTSRWIHVWIAMVFSSFHPSFYDHMGKLMFDDYRES